MELAPGLGPESQHGDGCLEEEVTHLLTTPCVIVPFSASNSSLPDHSAVNCVAKMVTYAAVKHLMMSVVVE